MELQYNEPLYDEVLEITVFFAPAIVNVEKKNLRFCQSLGHSLYRGSIITTFQEACCKQSLFLIAHPNRCKKRLPLLGRISGDIL